MTDPAIEAAQKLWTQWYGHELDTSDRYANCLIVGAREALKPIQDLHQRESAGTPTGEYAEKCCTCPQYWPCETARLIYTTEELQS